MDASGASSSSAADPINSSSYGVFINHRGPDTKKTFATDLYRRLFERGLKPFLDQEELKVGFNFPCQILGAIRSALVHVAIFSPTYAHSQWCLDELSLMLESGAPIIPIFFQVDPADLRWTDQKKKGVYAKALNELQMKTRDDLQTDEKKPRYDSATLQKWRKALSDVADISGFDLKGKFNGDEGLLLDEVVKRVVELMPEKIKLYVAKNPTGLDDKIEDLETTVLAQQHTGEVQVVGIVGLGGIGKTTLAKEIFNRKHSEYSNSYFLSDIRENARISLHSLQRKLMMGLFHVDRQIDDIHQGTEVLRQFLSSSKIFLILDDIDHWDHVDTLLPDRSVLHQDSLILITSRDEGVLVRSGVKESSMYRLTGLPYQHSQELFCSYAFSQPYPLLGFEDLVYKFLMACDGLPLSLIVFGALLFGYQDRSDWEAILHRLELPNDIKIRLKISYDALGNEERQIFLDIACFFIGKNKNGAITAWNGSGWKGSLGFKNLQLKCLAKVDDKDVIHMHDHLRDLGREIAETELPRRLWRPTGNINDWVHQQSSAIMEARGIRILAQGDSIEPLERRSQMLAWYHRWSHQMLGNSVILKLRNTLSNKRYRFHGFDVMNFQLVETQGHLLDRILRVRSPNLIWLSWRNCPYKYLPSWITIKKLRVLRVEEGVLETLWQGKWQAPLQLQELEIINASCLSSIPKSIGQLEHLERIVIGSSSLSKLPEEFGYLNSLKALVLRAYRLKSLPNSFGKLRNLYHMDLSRCSQLERLPDSFGSLSNLHNLELSLCRRLERLPDSFGSLSNLHSLDLNECSQLERLPDSFGSLSNLHRLNLGRCEKLNRLSDSFGSLTNLHSLALGGCSRLYGLPDSFGSLTNLHSMDLSGFSQLERLPDSFGGLTNLHSLNLMHCCVRLKRLPDSFRSLTNLHSINLSSCSQLERLPDFFGSLTNLRSISLSSCSELKRLPDSFGRLTNLHRLDLGYCSQLKRLPDSFGSLSSLKYFDAGSCSNLRISSKTFGNIRTLEHIDLSWCKKVEVWPWQLGHQRSLKVVKLTGTNLKKELPTAFELPSDLEVLWIGNPLLETVTPSLGDLRKLKELRLEYRGELKCLSASVEGSSQLSWLKVAASPIIRTSEVFFDEVEYPNLKELILEECINVVEVGTLPKRLQEVYLLRCDNLRSIEGLCGLAMLQALHIEKCTELEELPGVETMVSLQWLEVYDCLKLKSIRDLAQQTKLAILDVHRCPQLDELEGVSYCTSLRSLYVSGCPKLQWGERVVERLRQHCGLWLEEPNGS